MPKRTDIQKVLIIGAGPIIIGQACEFDYSGTQACKALKEEGYEIVLVNSNPATIMTDPTMADRTYVEPLTVESLEKIIKKERPDALLPTVGGQTGLNLSLDLAKAGILDKYGVEMLGAKADVIYKAEARDAFKKAMENIGLSLAKSDVAYTLEEAKEKAKKIGYPCVVRPAFTLGGTGGGHAADEEELLEIVEQGLMNSIISEVLIEESIVGWKEYELEVMRDRKDNVVIVCSIENLDPMGVHTGDSITVAPAQTLTDVEYQKMRNAAIAIMREIGVDTGGSNVQFALNPKDGRMVVIEMNPRVSRSSALASKATGFPIAKFAAKLAAGYTLDELQNDITKKTPACFEPALDYVVVKIPRFDSRKFTRKPLKLGTSMKAVGEVMTIGRTFNEAFQKGLRSLETGYWGFGFDDKSAGKVSKKALLEKISMATPDRIHALYDAFRAGATVDEIFAASFIDPWFLNQMKRIVTQGDTLDTQDPEALREAKRSGFSDRQLAQIDGKATENEIRKRRKQMNIHPTYGLVDTCAGEFEAYTPYYYSSYETTDERRPSKTHSVMILGGGPNRIGQGIEFDYCCVHASFASRESGFESIMVNSNPETVSTDFDISDKLFFEPLTIEDVLNIYDAEQPLGVIVQFGGQTPLNLARDLEAAGVRILGTSVDSIDRAEDRERSKQLLHKLKLKQPENGTATSFDEAVEIARRIGFPVVVRPSYVIGGTSMRIVKTEEDLKEYMENTPEISSERPVLLDAFLSNATEVDVDCVSDGKESIIAGIMEHIEPAGVHSGDSACVYPPISISDNMMNTLRTAAKALAKELKVVGLLNIQFAIKDEQLFVIEVNPRASRTVPFISKASGIPWIKIATKLMLGKTLKELQIREVDPGYYAVKESVFPFNRFDDTDTLLGPEMKSTGEVMGIDERFEMAFLKSQIAAGQNLSDVVNGLFVSVQDSDKDRVTSGVKQLADMGIDIYATEGTKAHLKANNIEATHVDKIKDKTSNTSVEMLRSGKVDLVVNTASDLDNSDEKIMRRTSLGRKIPFVSTIEGFNASVNAIAKAKNEDFGVKALQDYYDGTSILKTVEGQDNSQAEQLNIFVRQSFTESNETQSKVIQAVLDLLGSKKDPIRSAQKNRQINLLTGNKAYHSNNFKSEFEKNSGQKFTPENFRQYRLNLLNQADAFVIIRTALSESSVFEITYNIYKGKRVPIFFAIHKDAPIKTTLLKDLQDLVSVTYVTFDNPSDLKEPLDQFLNNIQNRKQKTKMLAKV